LKTLAKDSEGTFRQRFTDSLAIPIWFATALGIFLWPWLYPLGLVALAVMFRESVHRLLIGATGLGALIVVFGSSGQFYYFGSDLIQPETSATAMLFSLFLALGVHLCTRQDNQPEVQTNQRLWLLICTAAIFLLLIRFQNGIPLFSGDSTRLQGILSISPILGLLSGILPIATSFSRAPATKVAAALKIVLLVLVLGTGSRLLFTAVAIGFLSSFLSNSKTRPRFNNLALSIVLLLGIIATLVFVFNSRTESVITVVFSSRMAEVSYFHELVNQIFGPSLYLSARNGLSFFELMLSGSIRPPNGFTLGSIYNILGSGEDPERWLTSAVGLQVSQNGPTATPIWSGLNLDFGLVVANLLAMLIGYLIASFKVRNPELAPWFGFAIIFSSYGSYLLSTQFLASTALIIALKKFQSIRSKAALT
jgi:hypothetical protein